MVLHPATLLLCWVVLAVFLQSLSINGLALAALVLIPPSIFLARRRAVSLVRRSRWLLISIAVLFILATPGQRLPGVAGEVGITHDGLAMAGEHLLRLVLLLATLALLHERLRTVGMMAGLHWMLAPLSGRQALRERIVVRLMLVLEFVESSPTEKWRDWLKGESAGPASLELTLEPVGRLDWTLFGMLAILSFIHGWPG